jgi:hypothetical protein
MLVQVASGERGCNGDFPAQLKKILSRLASMAPLKCIPLAHLL